MSGTKYYFPFTTFLYTLVGYRNLLRVCFETRSSSVERKNLTFEYKKIGGRVMDWRYIGWNRNANTHISQ